MQPEVITVHLIQNPVILGQIKPTITISLMDAPVVQEVIDLLSAQEVTVDPLVEVALLQEAVVVEINNP